MFFMLFSSLLTTALGAGFSYDLSAKNGPASWGNLDLPGNQCGGNFHEQSPRDICGAQTVSLELGAQDSWKFEGEQTVSNNGHTIQVDFDNSGATRPQTMNALADQVGRTNGAGMQTWEVQQLHFHWGTPNGDGGSEHTLAGKYSSMEAHFVHYNTKYKDVTDAVMSGNKDALLVIGVFLNLSPTESGFITSMGDAVAGATKAGGTYTYDTGDFTEFAEANILRKDAVFDTYAGGLTTPTCNEIVTWVLMEQSCKVTQATLDKFHKASTNPKAMRLRRALGGDADEPISRLGNYRPLSLNKNPVYASSANSISSAKCASTFEQQLSWVTWQKTFDNCPAFGKYGRDNCAAGPDKCTREPTDAEGLQMCAEFESNDKCMNDANAQKQMGDCPKYAWKVVYPSCNRGYWASGCGQPALKQTATVKCNGKYDEHEWEAKDEMCTGKKPAATDRTCPKTMPCPRCKGCKRNGGCWKTCDNKAGKCSQCDSRGGRVGACCRRGAKDDPIECRLAEFQFASDNAHTCALLPADMHTGHLLKDILVRIDDLENDIDELKKTS